MPRSEFHPNRVVERTPLDRTEIEEALDDEYYDAMVEKFDAEEKMWWVEMKKMQYWYSLGVRYG